jgi:hypothetical protein
LKRIRSVASAYSEYSLKFELWAWLGTTFFSRRPKSHNGILHLGSGDGMVDGYCNADFFRFNVLRRLFLKKPHKELNWELDARRPLYCEDNFFEGIFSEHTLEHLSLSDVRRLLLELFRVLKAGGRIRLSVPDLKKYVDFYEGRSVASEFQQWEIPGEALWSLNHDFGHQCCFDGEFLGALLLEAGFSEVRSCDFKEGLDSRLLLELEERRWESLYIEAKKP